jgi:acyl-CoA thioesterase-1
MLKTLASLCCFLVLLSSSLATSASEPRILVYGDSLSAGFGIAIGQSWPALLGQRLKTLGSNLTVANASISGETTPYTNSARARFATALSQFKPAVVILALGANDGLRGLPVALMKDNLTVMVSMAKKHGARVLLVGMHLPPNYGPKYTQEFDAAFRDLARREKIALLPFLLEPIALDQNAFQADGLHPNAAAQSKILDHVWGALKPLLN